MTVFNSLDISHLTLLLPPNGRSVKEADKNLGGEAIAIVARPSEVARVLADKPDGKFVVQQHVKDPLLTDDGRKVEAPVSAEQ